MSREFIYTDHFVNSAASRIICTMERVLATRNYFCLSLCGASTPLPVYERVARDGAHLPWANVIITFGDERCVPPDHEQSNYRAAKLRLFDLVPIPEANILRIKGEETPEFAASEYERQMDAAASKLQMQSFNHDLILLGIGDDGHTASLFPGTDALGVTNSRVVANFVPKLNAHRVTFTLPFINRAERIMFLVDDAKKRPIVEDILANRGDYPAARIKPQTGNLTWMLGGFL